MGGTSEKKFKFVVNQKSLKAIGGKSQNSAEISGQFSCGRSVFFHFLLFLHTVNYFIPAILILPSITFWTPAILILPSITFWTPENQQTNQQEINTTINNKSTKKSKKKSIKNQQNIHNKSTTNQ